MTEQNTSTAPEGENGQDTDLDDAKQKALAAAAQEAESGNDEDNDDTDDDGKWDEAAARRKFDRMKADLDKVRAKAKALEPLAAEAEKRRKGEMSEAQKLQEEKAELQTQLAELTTANVRREAAEAANLPAKFVKFITAAEPDEALAQAKELAKELKAATGEDKKPDYRQGNRGSNSAGSTQSKDDLLRQMAGQR